MDNSAPPNSTVPSEGVSRNTVINLSDITLSEDCISLLSKGLNFCMTNEFDFSQFQIDLGKALRKLNLFKIFKNKNEPIEMSKGASAADIGKLGFLPGLNRSETDIAVTSALFELLEENEESIEVDVPSEQLFRGGVKSSFFPPLSPGSPLYNFHRAVLQELNALIYPTVPANLTPAELSALRWLKQQNTLVVKPADKGGNVVVMNKSYYYEEAMRQLSDEVTYLRLHVNPIPKYQEQLRSLLQKGVLENVLSQKMAEKLFPTKPSKPNWYFIPKIHKTLKDPPGRPIVAGRGSVSEPLSQYLDWFLRPLLKSVPSFLLDTTTCLRNLERVTVRPGLSLATIDVVSLYTRILHKDGIEAVRTFLERSNKGQKCTTFICEALDFVLKHNAFQFGDIWYVQQVGSAMGTPVAPTLANLFLALWEERTIYSTNNPFIRYIEHWSRFIDDVMVVWSGSAEQFEAFLAYINLNGINMQFTGNFGGNKIQFLDIQVELTNETIVTKGFRKPTATNSFLHHTSYHPPHVKKSLPYGQFLRLRRINNDYGMFLEQAFDLSQRLRDRGYDETLISNAFTKAIHKDRRQLLYHRKERRTETRCIFSFQFSPMHTQIRQAISKCWHILEGDSDLREKTDAPPIISFRRSRNLRDELVRGRFPKDKPKRNWLEGNAPQGNHKCGHCSHCKLMLKTCVLRMGAITHEVKQFITCRSDFVVYVIFCPCGFFYIGKTIRPLFKRIYEHIYSLRTGKGVPRFISHINGVHASNSDCLRFAGIQKIPMFSDGRDRHRELLRCESRWILDTNAMGPLGMNDRNDLSPFL